MWHQLSSPHWEVPPATRQHSVGNAGCSLLPLMEGIVPPWSPERQGQAGSPGSLPLMGQPCGVRLTRKSWPQRMLTSAAPSCQSVPARSRPPAQPPGPATALPQLPTLSRLISCPPVFSLILLFLPTPLSFLSPSQRVFLSPRVILLLPHLTPNKLSVPSNLSLAFKILLSLGLTTFSHLTCRNSALEFLSKPFPTSSFSNAFHTPGLGMCCAPLLLFILCLISI